jgi:acyl carrier protein
VTREQIYERVACIVTGYLRLQDGEVKPDSHIINDLGADSLALVELGFKFQEAFGIGLFQPSEANMIIGSLVDEIHDRIRSLPGTAS